MAISVAIAGCVGIMGAWAASTLNTYGRLGSWITAFFLACMVVAVAMPMILHAAAWEATAGKFGWLKMTQTGARADGVAFEFFRGLLACGWIHGMFGAAIVSLATYFGTSATPPALIEQSQMERGPISTWWQVRLPIALPWIQASLMGTAVLAATEMTVVDLYGYRTIADEFYLFYATDPSVLSILLTCFFPLAITGGFLTWISISRRRLIFVQNDHGSDQVSNGQVPSESMAAVWGWTSGLIAITIACTVTLVPIIGLMAKLGHETVLTDQSMIARWSSSAAITRLLEAPSLFLHEYTWTGIIGLVTGLVTVSLAWPLAAFARTHPKVCLLYTSPSPRD